MVEWSKSLRSIRWAWVHSNPTLPTPYLHETYNSLDCKDYAGYHISAQLS